MDLRTAPSSPTAAVVDPKLKRWFYPLIVLLICVPRVNKFPYKARREIAQVRSSRSSPDQVFRDFAARLAFLCWTDTDPAHIGACAVLANPDGVAYVFTFNNRSSSELAELKRMIQGTLDMFHGSPSSEDGQKGILRRVISCCDMRVKGYLRAFRNRLGECIQACARDNEADSKDIVTCLRDLQSATMRALTYTESGTEEVNEAATTELIWSVYRAYKSPLFDLIQKRGMAEERNASSTHWTELIHVAGRLMTYKQAIDVSLMAREMWPELFQGFRITMVPSGASASQVLNRKVLTTKEIINKTTSDDSLLEKLHSAAKTTESFQSFRLDEEVEKEWNKKPKDGRFCVHAEINLLQYLEQTEGGTDESRFFQGIKFIGTSKPPCKLCHYFFKEYRTDVQVPPSHFNLYGTWLMPTVTSDRGHSRGGNPTLQLAGKIKDDLRDDLLEALRGGRVDGRPHDSSNYRTRQAPATMDEWEGESALTEASGITYAGDSESAAPGDYREGSPLDNPVILKYIEQQVSLGIARAINSPGQRSTQQERSIALATGEDQSRGLTRSCRPTTVDIKKEEDGDEDGGGVLVFQGRGNLRTGVRRA